MAAAHVCMTCGLDLARLRVRRDQHYGLPLVICPSCATAAVRRKHPLLARYRQARRAGLALFVIAFQLGLVALFTFVNTFAAIAIALILLDVPDFRDEAEIRWVTILSMAVFPPILGTWLTISFRHLKRWRVWLGWFVFMLVPIALFGWGLAASDEFVIAPDVFGHDGWRGWATIALSTAIFAVIGAAPLAGMMIVATPGMLIGRALLWVDARVRQALWRFRLRNARRQRTT